MKTIRFAKITLIVAAFCLAAVIASPAQTFTTLTTFDGLNTFGPVALTQGTDGNLYGTGSAGGKNGQHNQTPGDGTVFAITPDGTPTLLYSFCSLAKCADGLYPAAGLTLAANGNYYGTTNLGGAGSNCFNGGAGCGVIFEISSLHKPTPLYAFCSQSNCADGMSPEEPLVQAFNGNLYGITFEGGSTNAACGSGSGCGTIFEITPHGVFTTLHVFCGTDSNCSDGSSAQAPLVLGSNGNLYGGANGGTTPHGTLFTMTPAGKFTKLHQFNGTSDGDDPSGLVAASDGNLYGTAAFGGITTTCSDRNGCGTFFKLTPTGQFTTLYSFCSLANCADGWGPYTGIIQGTDGNFYGTTILGGANTNSACVGSCGIIFQITPAGQVTTLYNFCSQTNCADGTGGGSLMQATDGKFYGTAGAGGLAGGCEGTGCGTVYSLDMGLAPFVQANPVFGKAGYNINILGNNLTGSTSVTFNGTAATFTVVSDTYIKATVPSGATSGTIQVTTPSGTLSSNVVFQVRP